MRDMFSAQSLLGALIDDNVAPAPAADADTTAGLTDALPGGTAGKVLLGAAGVAAAGGLAYAAYKHFKQPGEGGGPLGAPGPADPQGGWLGSPMGAQPQAGFGQGGGAPVATYANDPASWGRGPLQAPVPNPAPLPVPAGYGAPQSQVPTAHAPLGYGQAPPTQPTPAGFDPSAPWAAQHQPAGAPATPWSQQMPPRPPGAATVVSPPDLSASFPLPTGQAAPPRGAADAERQALLLVRAMVAAANVDGAIDAEERRRVVERVAAAGLGAAERAALEQELAAPQPPYVLLREVGTRELAEQFYVVSLLGIACDTDAERAYLRGLPYVLGMRPEDVARLHARLGVAQP